MTIRTNMIDGDDTAKRKDEDGVVDILLFAIC